MATLATPSRSAQARLTCTTALHASHPLIRDVAFVHSPTHLRFTRIHTRLPARLSHGRLVQRSPTPPPSQGGRPRAPDLASTLVSLLPCVLVCASALATGPPCARPLLVPRMPPVPPPRASALESRSHCVLAKRVARAATLARRSCARSSALLRPLAHAAAFACRPPCSLARSHVLRWCGVLLVSCLRPSVKVMQVDGHLSRSMP